LDQDTAGFVDFVASQGDAGNFAYNPAASERAPAALGQQVGVIDFVFAHVDFNAT
jgi:hypothetical protein